MKDKEKLMKRIFERQGMKVSFDSMGEDKDQLEELFGSSAEKMSDAVEDEENASPDPDLKGMVIDNQTSFKVFDGKPELAAKLMKELLRGGTMFKHLQQAQGDFAVKLEDLKKWVQGIGGVAVFAKRAAAIGSKIPKKGLPKSKMPFLPGPKDANQSYTAADVGDALTPGGKYNIDMMEKLHRHVTEKVDAPSPNTFVGMKSPEAQAFMTGGLNDGDPDDDVIKVKLNGEFAAADGIPTQTNILFPKALGMAMNGVAGGNLGAYASFKGEILDGHHRWAATMLNKPDATINTFALIDLDTLGIDKTLQYLTAIGNALGNKTKDK